MQTQIPEHILQTEEGYKADSILRNCVHCGFCTATCPTYQLLGDELDSPRGRIYLIKQVMEGAKPTIKTLSHLDRCLTCRSCETTCPSGVEYAKLLDIGRHYVEQRTRRSFVSSIKREALHWLMNNPKRFSVLYKIGQKLSFLLPERLRIPQHNSEQSTIAPKEHSRKVLLLQGCVQPAMQPGINQATINILDRLEIQVTTLSETECCGAISYHLNKQEQALAKMRHNIDTWYPYIEKGYEAIVSNASGCGITLKEYAGYFENDLNYAHKAQIISDRVKDISELVTQDNINHIKLRQPVKVAFHAPCTLQHGLKLSTRLENLLQALGCELSPVQDSHLCCGSSGTYSVLQPKISQQLKTNKLNNLQQSRPEYIVTANIGCQHHLASESEVPVLHWVELIAQKLS